MFVIVILIVFLLFMLFGRKLLLFIRFVEVMEMFLIFWNYKRNYFDDEIRNCELIFISK